VMVYVLLIATFPIQINGREIEMVKNFTYLGSVMMR